MSSLRNVIRRRTYKERAQPSSRKKFGLLEKHKDYVERAKAYHNKEETLRRLRQKAALRNPEEFNFKMMRARLVNGVHTPLSEVNMYTCVWGEANEYKCVWSEANEYTQEQIYLIKTQDIDYVLQKVESERKNIEELTTRLHNQQQRLKHVYFAEDRKRKAERTYRKLETSRNRLRQLEKIYRDMTTQKKGYKRKRREEFFW